MPLKEQLEVHGNVLFRYRGILPVVLLPFAYYFLYQQFDRLIGWHVSFSNYLLICFAVLMFGQFIRIFTLGYVAPNTSGRNTSQQVADSFNSTGTYSLVRHPLYVGNFFMGLGVAMISHHIWFCVTYILLFWIYYERIIFAEESYLRKKFSDKMGEWMNNTPTFIPSFSNFKRPSTSFNWKKIIRQEKNGFLATFLIFWASYSLKVVLIDDQEIFQINFYSIGLLLTGVGYAVIKLLKNKTKLLT